MSEEHNPFISVEDLPPLDITKEVQPIQDFLQRFTAFELVPESGKVVVLDVNLSVISALRILKSNRITSVPLWNSERNEYAGMFTVSDFNTILVLFCEECKTREALEKKMSSTILQQWQQTKKQIYDKEKSKSGELVRDPMSLYLTHVEATLYHSCRTLFDHKIHRAPIFEPVSNTILHIVTHARILRFLVVKWMQDCLLMNRTLRDLDLGIYENIACVKTNENVIQALQRMHERRISALPMIDSEDKVVGVFSMSDIRYLSISKIFTDLNTPVEEYIRRVQAQQNHLSSETIPRPIPQRNIDDSKNQSSTITPNSSQISQNWTIITSSSSSITSTIPSQQEPNTNSQLQQQDISSIQSSSHSAPLIVVKNTRNTLTLYYCRRDDKIKEVLAQLARRNIHRLVVVDDQMHVSGIVSVSDILRLFILKQSKR